MFEAIASVLSLIVQPCYELTGNWWLSILLFTIIIKIILMPLSLWCQKNSIVMVQVMPALNRIKVKYFGDRETIGEKQNEMYKEQHYHPMLSLIPLAVQIIILFGLVEVIHGITDNGAPGTEFLGMIPFEDGGLSWIMPPLAALSAVAMGCAQNVINPLQREQSRAEKNTTNGLSIALSLFLAVFVAAGMAFYWICSNLTAILVQVLCNIIVNPKKYIDYEDLAASRAELEELTSLQTAKKRKRFGDPLAKREKADYKRFFNTVDKHLVFYAESTGFYKYFKNQIDWLLANSDLDIHYITNDPDDNVFNLAKEQPRIKPYYIDVQKQITLMMKMDADVVVCTQDDLDNYYIKRSYVRKDVEYIYTCHHIASCHMTGWKHAYDNFDGFMCVGPHMVRELEAQERIYNLPRKKMKPQIGYPLIDRMIEDYEAQGEVHNPKPVVMIGPSWQEDNILDNCIDEMITSLVGKGYYIIVRPHPEYVKRYRPKWEKLQERWSHISPDELHFEKDFSSNSSVFNSDVLITDWSNLAFDFSFSTLKPALFVDTKMKVNNPDWEELDCYPMDLEWRDTLGRHFAPSEALSTCDYVADFVENAAQWRDQIEKVRSESIFNVGHSTEVAGEFLLSRVLAKQAQRMGADAAAEPVAAAADTAAEPATAEPAADAEDKIIHARHVAAETAEPVDAAEPASEEVLA